MTSLDIVIGALTAWRENRGGGVIGMQSVINVLVNRALKRRTSVYHECVRPYQFSSMTAHADPELVLFPADNDEPFKTALALMDMASQGKLGDVTGGATFYYAVSIATPPAWAKSMQQTEIIAGQIFFREVSV